MRRAMAALIFVFAALHLFRITEGPNGFHKWRETDTASISRNFFTETTNILSPRMDVRGAGDGRIGMEFPLYSYVNGFLFQHISFNHLWSRLITLLCGCVALYAFFSWLSLLLTTQQAFWSAVALACSPLFFFYSRKIQPDVMALMFSLLALWQWQRYLGVSRQSSAQNHPHADRGAAGSLQAASLTALSLALALLIKPTYFVVGAPMLAMLVLRKGMRSIVAPRYLLVAITTIAPAAVWFKQARDLNASLNSRYFFLGNQWDGWLDALFSRAFFQNLFLTWFWELGIGIVLVPFFIYGWKERRRYQELKVLLWAWFAAAAVSFVLTAHHIASPHDYYVLPLVPALALITGLGIHAMRQSSSRNVQRVALALLMLAPIGTLLRLKDRYGEAYDFAEGRAWAAEHLASQAGVIAVDKIPAYLLYRLGHKGWNIQPHEVPEFREAIQQGARYLAVSPESEGVVEPLRSFIKTEVAHARWVVVYEVGEPRN